MSDRMGAGDGEQGEKRQGRILQYTGPGPLPSIPDDNWADFLLHQMASYGDAVAVVESETGRQRTYSQLCHLIPRVAGGLAASGVGLGSVVLFLMPCHMDYPLVALAIVYRGAICVPANTAVDAEELGHMLHVSGARWAVVHEGAVDTADAAFALLPSTTLKKMWILGTAPGRPTVADLMTHNPAPPVTRAEGLDSAMMAALMPFSSGTTGLPKGVLLSHRSLVAVRMRDRHQEEVASELEQAVRRLVNSVLMIMPVAHLYGTEIVMCNLYYGRKIVFLSEFSPKKYFETIERYKITQSPLVPHLVKFLNETPLLKKYNVSSVRSFFYSTAPLDAASHDAFEKKMGVQLSTGYGLTETCAAVAVNGGPNFKPNSVGKVIPYNEIKIVDKDGKLLGEGEKGEVCVRGAGTMLGYANNPDATAAMIDKEGWVHTGDIGCYDADEFLYITDRIKDIIKVKGYQVVPSELERVLLLNPHVADAAVVGIPHHSKGEVPRAYVVLKPNSTLKETHIQRYVADRVAKYKQLTGGIKFVDSIPRNPTGKVLKRLLKEEFKTPTARL